MNNTWNGLISWVAANRRVHLTVDSREFPDATAVVYGGLVVGMAGSDASGLVEYCVHRDKVKGADVGERVAQIESKDGVLFTLVATRGVISH